jgi:hypothetical protein
MTTLRRWSAAVLLATQVLVSACSGAQTPQMALKEAVEDYTRSMRWGFVEKAGAHIPDNLRAAWIRQRRIAQSMVTVHEYDIRAVEHVVGTEKARVIVLAVWSRPSDPVAHNEMLAQEWRYRDRNWWMITQYPVKADDPGQEPLKPTDAL